MKRAIEKRSRSWMAACAIAATALASQAFADPTNEIGTNGYFRTGIGVSEGGNGQAVFQAPGASAKYRLGNENDTYFEIRAFDTIRPSGKDGFSLRIDALGNFYTPSSNGALPFGSLQELYIEAANFTSFAGNPSIWVGRPGAKFRDEIHINDYFFLSNGWYEAADGGGVRDIDPGVGKVDVMVLRANAASVTTRTAVTQTTADVKWRDIAVNPGGTLKFWGLYAGSNSAGGAVGTKGWSAGVFHDQGDLLGGKNRLGVQLGRGLGRSAGALYNVYADTSLGQVTTSDQAKALEKAQTFRVLDELVLEPTKNFSIGFAGVYEDRKSVEYDGKTQVWMSAGVRPYYYFTDHFRVALEAGYDHVRDRSAADVTGSLVKGTIAPEFALARGFWSRPVIRLFATYAAWSQSFKGLVGGPAYANATQGWSAGTQIETWW